METPSTVNSTGRVAGYSFGPFTKWIFGPSVMADSLEKVDFERAFRELQVIQRRLNLLSDFLLERLQDDAEIQQKSAAMIDPRTGRPFNEKNKV
jgi:hypothetical protein